MPAKKKAAKKPAKAAARKPAARKATKKPAAKKSAGGQKYEQAGAPWWKKFI